jgi:hypothetical protein
VALGLTGAVVVVLAVSGVDDVPQVARLELQLHEKSPLVVVRLRQLGPVAGAAGLTNHALDDDFARTARLAPVQGSGVARA